MGFVLLVLMPTAQEPPDCRRDEMVSRGWIFLDLTRTGFPFFLPGSLPGRILSILQFSRAGRYSFYPR